MKFESVSDWIIIAVCMVPTRFIYRVPNVTLTPWHKINMVLPFMINNLHVKFESDRLYSVACIVSTRKNERTHGQTHSRSQSSGDLITWHKYLGDCPRDLPPFPTKNPIFQLHVPNLLGSMRFHLATFCIVHIFLHPFPVVIFDYLLRDL